MGREQFTSEQLAVVDALVNAHAEAARDLARVTSRLNEATHTNDVEGFEAAKSATQLARLKCEALMLAVEMARKVFSKPRAGVASEPVADLSSP